MDWTWQPGATTFRCDPSDLIICRTIEGRSGRKFGGVLWTIAGDTPRSMGIIGEAAAAEPSGLTFLQISDSHVGFDKPANPNAIGMLEEAINKIKTLPVKPSFVTWSYSMTVLCQG
jgi:hypothetical protein